MVNRPGRARVSDGSRLNESRGEPRSIVGMQHRRAGPTVDS